MSDESLANRFLNAFSVIESTLAAQQDRRVDHNDWVRFGELLEDSDTLLRSQKQDLRVFARLRNAIAHNDYLRGKPIAEPRLDTVIAIEKIAQLLTSPPKLVDTLRERPAPTILQPSDNLHAFLQLVTNNDFSQAPVQKTDGYSLITTNAVARWFAASRRADDGEVDRHVISDVLEYAEAGDRLQTVNPTTSVVQAINIFAGEAQSASEPPAALLVMGKMGQRPQLLCTRSDLGDLYAAIDSF